MSTKQRHGHFALPFDTPQLLTTDNLVELFPGTTRKTWHRLRSTGEGPAATKVAGRLYYPRAEVEDWASSRMTTCA